MKIYIALLRGINVSGQKMIKMETLRKMCEDLKFNNVKTYVQSGNIIFQYKETELKKLEGIIQKAILKTFSFDVEVFITTKEILENIVTENPFTKRKEFDEKALYVCFLSDEPEQVYMDKLKELKIENDEFFLAEKVVYIFPKNGYGNSKLNNNFFENKLKVSATTRNWKTVNELIKMAENIQ